MRIPVVYAVCVHRCHRHCQRNGRIPVGDWAGNYSCNKGLKSRPSAEIGPELSRNSIICLMCKIGGRAPVGNPRGLYVADNSKPEFRQRQPQTNTRKCGIQPAHKSMPAVV